MRAGYVVVVGANSIVGSFLLDRLAREGFSGECISRSVASDRGADPRGFQWRQLDVQDPGDWRAPPDAIVISLLPIWLLPALLPRLEAARQLILIGTTSIFAKAKSSDPQEIELVERLLQAELRVRRFCSSRGLSWTILRPTLIYDGQRDGNISSIARFIQRFRFFPVSWPARGLRQPIHADDVAQAVLAAIGNPVASNTALNLPGPDTLPYREMVHRIFDALGRRPLIVPLPNLLLELGFRLARRLRRFPYSPALFERMNQDLAFDGSLAREALNYTPRPFRPRFHRPDQ